MIYACLKALGNILCPPTQEEDFVSLESFSERIAKIRASLERACETRVFEFRLEEPCHFVEFINVDSELKKTERLLPNQTMKATALQINEYIKNASFFLRKAEKTPVWHRIA